MKAEQIILDVSSEIKHSKGNAIIPVPILDEEGRDFGETEEVEIRFTLIENYDCKNDFTTKKIEIVSGLEDLPKGVTEEEVKKAISDAIRNEQF